MAVFIMPLAYTEAALSCPLGSNPGRTVVSFDGSAIVSGSNGINETSAFTTTIPAGTYNITLVSYDDHNAETVTQSEEQWFLIMKNSDGSATGWSTPISDLPNGQNYLQQTVNLDYIIPRSIAKVTARHHATYALNENSVIPVCAGLDLTDGSPLVTTDAAHTITDHEAILKGYVNPNGTSEAVHWFEWGISASSLSSKTQEQSIAAPETISTRLTGLTKNTIYYFRAAARNAMNSTYGPMVSFTTTGVALDSPIVSTSPASNMTEVSATLNGFVNPNGTSNTVRWFAWGATPNLGMNTSEVSVGSSGIAISEHITGLTRGTTYYAKAYARNSHGVSEGNLISFQTAPFNSGSSGVSSSYRYQSSALMRVPVVSTQLPTSIGQKTVVLNGKVTSDPHGETKTWFEWGTQSILGSQTIHKSIGYVSQADFSDSLKDLLPDTFYYVRAVAENTSGRSYGATFLFETLSVNQFKQLDQLTHVFDVPVISSPVTHQPPKIPSFNDGPGRIILNINPSNAIVQAGHLVPLIITFENTSKHVLADAILTVHLPPELSYRDMSGSPATVGQDASINGAFDVITWQVGNFDANQKGVLAVNTMVQVDTIDNKIFTTSATMTYNDTVTETHEKETAFAINTVDIPARGLAALLFAGGLGLWLLFGLGMLLLLGLLIFFYKRNEDKKRIMQ